MKIFGTIASNSFESNNGGNEDVDAIGGRKSGTGWFAVHYRHIQTPEMIKSPLQQTALLLKTFLEQSQAGFTR